MEIVENLMPYDFYVLYWANESFYILTRHMECKQCGPIPLYLNNFSCLIYCQEKVHEFV